MVVYSLKESEIKINALALLELVNKAIKKNETYLVREVLELTDKYEKKYKYTVFNEIINKAKEYLKIDLEI